MFHSEESSFQILSPSEKTSHLVLLSFLLQLQSHTWQQLALGTVVRLLFQEMLVLPFLGQSPAPTTASPVLGAPPEHSMASSLHWSPL